MSSTQAFAEAEDTQPQIVDAGEENNVDISDEQEQRAVIVDSQVAQGTSVKPKAEEPVNPQHQGEEDSLNSQLSSMTLDSTVTLRKGHYSVPNGLTPAVPDTSSWPKRKKYYVVTCGRKTGIFDDWLVVKPLVNKYSGCAHMSYKTLENAVEAWTGHVCRWESEKVDAKG